MDMRGGPHDGDVRSPGSLTYAHFSSRPTPLPERKRDLQNDASILSDHLQRQASVDPTPDPISAAGLKPSKAAHHGSVRYRECLKNHAANIGGNVVDGCGEFMPTGEDGTLEALKCAACECHRNFHRKEVEGETQFSSSCRRSVMVNPVQLPLPLPSPTASLHHHMFHNGAGATAMVTPMNVAYCGGMESSSEDLNAYVAPAPYAVLKKRSRTKFTAEQKQRMLEFAEKVGWRFQRQDEEEIDKFCGEVGVKRQVFKVWMHNNKNAMKLKPDHYSTPPLDHHHAPPPTTLI